MGDDLPGQRAQRSNFFMASLEFIACSSRCLTLGHGFPTANFRNREPRGIGKSDFPHLRYGFAGLRDARICPRISPPVERFVCTFA
jgi:hypothetical protein